MLVRAREVFVGSLDGNCEVIFVVSIVVVWFLANRASRTVVTDFLGGEVRVAVEGDRLEEGRSGFARSEIFVVIVPFAVLRPIVFVLEINYG